MSQMLDRQRRLRAIFDEAGAAGVFRASNVNG
jgi:hypothetical protein